jgi:hypothetical protein
MKLPGRPRREIARLADEWRFQSFGIKGSNVGYGVRHFAISPQATKKISIA